MSLTANCGDLVLRLGRVKCGALICPHDCRAPGFAVPCRVALGLRKVVLAATSMGDHMSKQYHRLPFANRLR